MPAYPINTTVQLLHDVPLSPRMPHRIRFASASARESYFAGKVYNSQTEIQLQRVEGIYRLPVALDDAIAACNYMRWQNKTGQWYYAFITSMEYMNSNLTRVEFEVDAWTTFQFDLTWGDCFIERECVSIDNIGTHTLPEDISLGTLQYSQFPDTIPIQANGNVSLAPAIFIDNAYRLPEIAGEYSFNRVTNNLPQSLVVWSGTRGGTYNTWQTQLNQYLEGMAGIGKLEGIVSATFLPTFVFENADPNVVASEGTASPLYGYYFDFSDAGMVSTSYTQPIDVKWNSPTYNNNKMYTFPFNYYFLTNNNGDRIDLQPEYMALDTSGTLDYSKRQLSLTFRCDITPTPTLTAIPTDYQGGGLSTHATTLQNFPIMATTGNAYANWVGGHAASLSTGLIMGGLGIGVSMATQNLSGISQSTNSMIDTAVTMADKSRMPDTVLSMPGNIGNYAAQKFGFSIVKCQVKGEYGAMIDNYFSMYGYKVNRMGTPEFGTRQYWNFYKIPSCVVYGDIPGDYLEQIRDLFINGVTLWNTADVGNYHNGSNPIVGG